MQNPSPFHCPLDLRFRRLVAQKGDLTAARADILPDGEWHGSDTFNLRFRPAQMHEVLYSAMRTRSPAHYHILAFGGPSHRPTERDRQCVELLHRELVPMIGTSLASHRDISAHGLSPRRRQILELLIEGPPEKIIADRIGLRPSTVNEYLQHLYAHFGVHTRAELMAYFARRTPRRREVPPNC